MHYDFIGAKCKQGRCAKCCLRDQDGNSIEPFTKQRHSLPGNCGIASLANDEEIDFLNVAVECR